MSHIAPWHLGSLPLGVSNSSTPFNTTPKRTSTELDLLDTQGSANSPLHTNLQIQVTPPADKSQSSTFGHNPEWSEHWNDEHQCYYYTNSRTGETTWQKPKDYKLPPMLSPQSDGYSNFGDESTYYEWEQFWNDEYDRWYYVSDKGETVWEKPKDAIILVHDKDESFATTATSLSVDTSIDGSDIVTISTPKVRHCVR